MSLVACAGVPRQRPGDRAADALLVGIEAHGTGGAAMSRLTRIFAGAVLIFSFLAIIAGSAEARWYGGHWHGGWRGGWGWGPAFGLGLGLGYGWGWGYPYAYYPGPYYYAVPPQPACGWARIRVWRNGHWAYRRAWRCW